MAVGIFLDSQLSNSRVYDMGFEEAVAASGQRYLMPVPQR